MGTMSWLGSWSLVEFLYLTFHIIIFYNLRIQVDYQKYNVT